MAKKKKKEERIYDVFINLVNELGYDNVSIRKIATASNVGLGTIYRSYEYGKLSLLSKFLEKTSENVLDIESFQNIPKNNLPKLVELYISNHLKTHRNNLHIHKALYQAAISDKVDVDQAKKLIFPMLKNSLEKILTIPLFNDVPKEQFTKTFTQIFNVIEGVIHRHLYVLPIFEIDEELIEYLTEIVIFLLRDFNTHV